MLFMYNVFYLPCAKLNTGLLQNHYNTADHEYLKHR